MKVAEEKTEQQQPELELLIDWDSQPRPPVSITVISSVVLHILGFIVLWLLPAMPGPSLRDTREIVDVSKAIPLLLPPDVLTQIAANNKQVSKEVDLAGLIARPEIKPQPSVTKQAKRFEPPPAPAATQPKPVDPIKIEAAPNLQVAQTPPALGNGGPSLPIALPPPPPPVEKPKLAFETPGAQSGSTAHRGLIEAPKTSISDVGKSVLNGGGAMIIADSDFHMPGASPNQGAQGRSQSSLELLSDPMGVDFKPYLIQVLAAVRRNWFNILPEGARMGQRGRTVVQFSIAKDGSVPKLVIHFPSGNEPLDRAAVAGISASNPFPPLPLEYRGNVLRLQLVFSYNMPNGSGIR